MRPGPLFKGAHLLLVSLVLISIVAAPAMAGNTISFSGEILASPPVAAFIGSPLSGTAPLTVAFTDASTGSITGWAWDFNNDGTVDSTQQSPTHEFTAAGTYTVKLTVTGPGGSDDEVKAGYVVVSPPDVPPVAAFIGTPTSGYAPLAVQFTDQSANDPTTWQWEYRKGSGSWTQFSTAQSPSYTFTAAGTYSIRLTATNAAGSNTVTKTSYITVSTLVKPVAAFKATPTSGYPPLAVQFTDQSTNAPASWKWEYQKSGTGTWTQFSTAQSPSYTFTAAGTYSIRLTATNAAGSNTVTKTSYITVGHTGLVIAYYTGSPTSGNKPLVVHFTDRSFGNVDTWEWDFQNDGTYDSSAQNPDYTYTAKGKYDVRLRVTNANSISTMIRYGYVNVK